MVGDAKCPHNLDEFTSSEEETAFDRRRCYRYTGYRSGKNGFLATPCRCKFILRGIPLLILHRMSTMIIVKSVTMGVNCYVVVHVLGFIILVAWNLLFPRHLEEIGPVVPVYALP